MASPMRDIAGFSRLAISGPKRMGSRHSTAADTSTPERCNSCLGQGSSSIGASRGTGRATITRSKPSPAAQRLVKAQAKMLSRILEDVHAAGPEKYVKHSHWAWYVWPTTKEGMSDPLQTAVKDVTDVAFVLGEPTLDLWAELLEALAAALRARGSRRVFPSIDHGRIEFFLREWGAAHYRQKMPDKFAAAVDQFAQAWTNVS